MFTVFRTHTNHPLPETFGALVFLVILIVASVKFGQRAVAGPQLRHEGTVLRVGNVILILLLILLLIPATATVFAAYGPRTNEMGEQSYNEGFNDGLEIAAIGQDAITQVPGATIAIDGKPVTNLFVYDADGNPVPQARVVNQDGLPLSFSEGMAQLNEVNGEVQLWAGVADAYGCELGNVFPKTIWTLDQDAEYCTAEDEQLWQEIRSGEFYLEEGKLFTSLDGEPVATVVGATPDDGENNRVIDLTGGPFTSGQDCIKGLRISWEVIANQAFPAERIAPLAQKEVNPESAPDTNDEGQESIKKD